jgi:hypothetical protein
VFFVNLPVGVIAFLAAIRFLTESVNPHPRRLDPAGQLLGIAALGSLVYALIEGGGKGWTSPPILAMFALAAAAFTALLVVEARQSQPMIELRFFRSPSFSGTNLIAFLTFFALLGFTFFNTLYFQEIRGYSAFGAGLLGLPATLAIVVIAPLAGRIAGARGPGLPIALGTALAGSGLLALLWRRLDTPYSHIWWTFALFGAGLGLVTAPMAAGGGGHAALAVGRGLGDPQHQPAGRRRGRDRAARRSLLEPLPRRPAAGGRRRRQRDHRRLPGP